jgi:DNA-binding NtrC family response regulator
LIGAPRSAGRQRIGSAAVLQGTVPVDAGSGHERPDDGCAHRRCGQASRWIPPETIRRHRRHQPDLRVAQAHRRHAQDILSLDQFKRLYIRHVVQLLGGNISLAAARLKIHRHTIAAALKDDSAADSEKPGA